jgi:ABC-type uncharacterized transport system ATPase subunit
VVETQDLSMQFGGVAAVDGVNFRLERDELRCLIGPNGAGKSTFFKCLTGMLRPSAGRVLIDGEDVTGWHPHEIARLGVGIKTQVPSVFDNLTVRENLWLAAYRVHRSASTRSRIAAVQERLRIGEIAGELAGRLSHGERQRVELGIVIVGDPWLILLDEPAAGMTGQEVDQMAQIVRELNEHASIILVEHDMQFIRAIARKVTVFNRGRVLAEDNVEAIMNNPVVRDIYLGKKA